MRKKWTDEQKARMSAIKKGKKLGPMSEERRLAIKAAKNTPEAKERARNSHLGKKLSEEHKAAIKTGLNKPETRAAMSAERRTRRHSEETKQKLREIMNSEEVNKKISEGVLRAYANPEMRQRQLQATLSFITTDEYKQKMSEIKSVTQNTEEYKAKHREIMNRPEIQEKLHKPHNVSDENREKFARSLSIRSKERWSHYSADERREMMHDAIMASHVITISRLEIQIQTILNAIGIKYHAQYKVDRYYIDFYLPEQNIALEANGCYWHGCEACGYDYPERREQDAKRKVAIEKGGIKVAEIWEHELIGAHAVLVALLELEIERRE